jgi:PAS domain S-box-containing protein
MAQSHERDSDDEFNEFNLTRRGQNEEAVGSAASESGESSSAEPLVVLPAEAHRELSETEARYRALSESSFDLISEMDEAGVYTYVSPNHPEVLGYEEGELLGRSFFERLHPDDRRRVEAGFCRHPLARPAGSGRVPLSAQEQRVALVREHGPRHLCASSHAPQTSGGASFSRRVVLISRDITPRKKHEQQLAALFAVARTINAQNDLHAIAAQLAALLKPLLPFSWLGISLLEGETLRLVATGGVGAARLGSYLSRRAHAWHPIWESLHQNRVWVVNSWDYERYAPASLTRAFINVPLTVDGHTIGVLHFDSLRAHVFTGEHEQLARMVGEQVAVAVRSARLLELSRASEARFRDLINDVDAIVWEASAPDFDFSFVSPQAQRWLGFPQKQWLESPGFWARHIHPDDRDATMQAFHERIRKGENHRLEYRMIAHDGRTIWVENSVRVEVLGGQPTRARGVMFDVTELKSALSALSESNAFCARRRRRPSTASAW